MIADVADPDGDGGDAAVADGGVDVDVGVGVVIDDVVAAWVQEVECSSSERVLNWKSVWCCCN